MISALIGAALCAAVVAKAEGGSGLNAWIASAPPAGQVAIWRDPWGVPHVQARCEEDGFYGLGYAVAEDNLEDLFRQFAIGRGQMARFFGAPYVEIDRWYAMMAVGPEAALGYRRLADPIRRALDAYVAGIRRYMADHPRELPVWARGFVPRAEDLVGFEQLFVLMFPVNTFQGVGDCRRGGIDLPSTMTEFLELLRTGGPGGASASWAVAPWRTAEGVTIHLADPHNSLDIPSPEIRFHAGDLEMNGFLTAVPFMLTGHTRTVAWGTTFGSPDVADCYAIQVDPARPDQFLFDGRPQPIERQEITIAVRGEPDRRMTVESVRLNGLRAPIVRRVGNIAYAVATPYLEHAEGSVVDLYRMAKARDLVEFREAMSAQGLFPVGITAADAGGNLFHVRAGRSPVRPAGQDWTRPVSGNSSATAWTGLHPFANLIQVMNPKQGYIRETNLAPSDMWGEDPPVVISNYPEDLVSDVPELTKGGGSLSRGFRTDDLLSRSYAMTVAGAIEVALDQSWPFVPRWQRALASALRAAAGRGDHLGSEDRGLAERILRFDGVAGRDSRDAVIFYYWMAGITAAGGGTGAPEVRELSEQIRFGREVPAAALGLLLTGLRRAAVDLTKDFGTMIPVFGDIFRIGRGGETFPVGGCSTAFEATLRNYACPRVPGSTKHLAAAGQKELTLTVFSKPIQSFSLAAFGTSWRPTGSRRHFNDQARLASERRLKPAYFEWDQLQRARPSKVVLRYR